MRRKAVKITKENAVRNDKLEIFHVAVGVRSSGMVIEHQQNAGDEQNDEKNERDGAEVIRGADAQRLFADLDRHPMEEKIAEDRKTAGAICVCRAAAKYGLPHFRFTKAL